MPFVKDLDPEFSKRFAAWVRLEPRCRRDDFSVGLEARTADPLWSLGRQWQTGELTAEDAGSPVNVTVNYSTWTPTNVLRDGDDKPVPAPSIPYEPIVEQEHLALSWRDRIQIGQKFERLVRHCCESPAPGVDAGNVVAAYRENAEYALALPAEGKAWSAIDYATRRLLKIACGRAVDGQKLLDRMDFDATTPSHSIALCGNLDSATLDRVVNDLRDWCLALGLRPEPQAPPAWRNPNLDYRFQFQGAAAAPARLVAPDYRNGDLDWHSFNLQLQGGPTWKAAKPVSTRPSPISVGGSSSRWWAFEDAATDFGSIEAASTDLARLFLMDFLLLHGDDWYSVPLPVSMPSLVRIDAVQVSNVFDDALVPVAPARKLSAKPGKCFDLFSHTAAGSRLPMAESLHGSRDAALGASMLFIPSVSGRRHESPPLEEVRFLRDEGANKVWAVEHKVMNGLGRATDASNAQFERQERKATAASTAQPPTLELGGSSLPRYRLATSVPENWFPFAPFNAATGGKRRVVLRRAAMLHNADDEQPSIIAAASRLLEIDEDPLLWLEEISVGRSGALVQLAGQHLRWVDGKSFVWIGRKVQTGRGEGSSGLRFDGLSPPSGED
jgi:hypothetical protein